MKKIIVCSILVLFALTNVSTATAQGFWKKLGRGVVSTLVGATEAWVGSGLNERDREGWNNMTRDFNNAVGLDNNYVNAGSKWQQGKKNDAILDFTEGVTTNAGIRDNALVSTVMGCAHANNNYNNNIASGMSKEEATKAYKDEMVNVDLNVYDNYMVGDNTRAETARYETMIRDKETRRLEEGYRNQIWHELLGRGYSRQEAQMYMTIFEENPGMLTNMWEGTAYSTTDMLVWDENLRQLVDEKANALLDNMNIADRTNGNKSAVSHAADNMFFGVDLSPVTLANTSAPSTTSEPAISSTTPLVAENKTVDPSAEAKARLEHISTDHYQINHAWLNQTQKETLDEVVSLMSQFPDIQICLNGHTCDLGTESINNNIAIKRANKVKEYLVMKGVDAKRIKVESKAATEPVVNGTTEEDRLRNRRVSITVINNEK